MTVKYAADIKTAVAYPPASLVNTFGEWMAKNDKTQLRILGIGLLMIIAVYLWFCAFAKHRHMTIKGQKLVLPSWKFALAQMLISSVNWMVMGAIIWLLLGQSVNYFFVLGVLLVSSIAGVQFGCVLSDLFPFLSVVAWLTVACLLVLSD